MLRYHKPRHPLDVLLIQLKNLWWLGVQEVGLAMFRPRVQVLLNFAQFCNSNQFIKTGEIGWAFGTYYKALDKWDFLEAIL
jgi:hypothetical protein